MVEGALSSQHSAFSKIEGPWKVVSGSGLMLSGRTRVLFAISSLAPASILIWRLPVESIVRDAKEREEFAPWVDPGIMYYVLLFVGLVSFVSGVVS
jgi:hypothetical protein